MKHECKVTVLETKVFPDLQREYLADPESGPCPCFAAGQEFLFRREAGADDLALRARLGPGVPLRRGVGLHLALHLHGAAGRLHHARLDARRPPHGRLLQRRHPPGRLQAGAHRHPRDPRGGGVARVPGLRQHPRGCLHGGGVEEGCIFLLGAS